MPKTRRRPAPPEVTITTTGRKPRIRFHVTCTHCGPVSLVQTTRAYAEEAAARHTATRHAEAA